MLSKCRGTVKSVTVSLPALPEEVSGEPSASFLTSAGFPSLEHYIERGSEKPIEGESKTQDLAGDMPASTFHFYLPLRFYSQRQKF